MKENVSRKKDVPFKLNKPVKTILSFTSKLWQKSEERMLLINVEVKQIEV